MSQSANGQAVSRTLARFVAGTRRGDIPPAVRHEARRSLVNFVAAALGGCRDQASEALLGVLARFAAPGPVPVIGRPERVDALTGAFVNAAAGNVLDFDDTHIPTVIHPTAPVFPALMALAFEQPVSGADLLDAFVLGVEVACRLGDAVSPGHYRRGWHITATCGVFGAAAAAGRLLRLDEGALVFALGNALAQSCGVVETLGTMAKSVGVGNAARGGLLSALLAQRGVTGPDRPLEGERGFMAVTGGAHDPALLTRGLGEDFALTRNTYKPYPCGVVLNPVIDAALELRARHRLSADAIANVTVFGHPLLAERTDRAHPLSGREAQVSAQHSLAVALIHGAAGVGAYTDDAVGDPRVLALRAKVQLRDDAALAVGAARVAVTLSDGTVLKTTIAHARGSLERPLTDGELAAKLVMLAAHGCPRLPAAPLIDALWSIDESPDVRAVLRLAAPV